MSSFEFVIHKLRNKNKKAFKMKQNMSSQDTVGFKTTKLGAVKIAFCTEHELPVSFHRSTLQYPELSNFHLLLRSILWCASLHEPED